jgi:hypothetical protein
MEASRRGTHLADCTSVRAGGHRVSGAANSFARGGLGLWSGSVPGRMNPRLERPKALSRADALCEQGFNRSGRRGPARGGLVHGCREKILRSRAGFGVRESVARRSLRMTGEGAQAGSNSPLSAGSLCGEGPGEGPPGAQTRLRSPAVPGVVPKRARNTCARDSFGRLFQVQNPGVTASVSPRAVLAHPDHPPPGPNAAPAPLSHGQAHSPVGFGAA